MLKRMSQLEDELIQYWHRINTLEDQLKDINNEKAKLGAKMLLAIPRNDTTILEDIFNTTQAPMSCDLEPDIHIGYNYSSHEPPAGKYVYQGLQEIGSLPTWRVSEHQH